LSAATGQEFVQRHILRSHGVAAGSKLQAGPGKPVDMVRQIEAGAAGVKGPPQQEGDMIGAADIRLA
jgi:hypothetical protein